jgi:hypothetical protein
VKVRVVEMWMSKIEMRKFTLASQCEWTMRFHQHQCVTIDGAAAAARASREIRVIWNGVTSLYKLNFNFINPISSLWETLHTFFLNRTVTQIVVWFHKPNQDLLFLRSIFKMLAINLMFLISNFWSPWFMRIAACIVFVSVCV